MAHEKFKGVDVELLVKKKHMVFDVKGFLREEIVDGL